ncbi:MAG: response regulator [Chloroflexi bacterium]|nr:response regulator [Chloroflexota bacterium]
MSGETIRVLIVDDNLDTRENLRKMLYFEEDIEVVDTAAGGLEGIEKAKELTPHVVLLDINMPGVDGIRAAERLRAEAPASAVIMMSVQGEQEYLRRAMVAGASDYLIKPFSTDDLVGSIHMVHERDGHRYRTLVAPTAPTPTGAASAATVPVERAKVIAIFSPKGGAGTTTVAVNLACALKLQTGRRVALLDCSLIFGDVAVMLNLISKNSLADLTAVGGDLDVDLIQDVMVDHASGVKVLLAPPRPEMGETVTAEHLGTILAKLRSLFDYIVVDTMHSFQDVMLSILDVADKIVVLTTPEVTALKNIKLLLETIEVLGYHPSKLALVVNRVDSHGGINIGEIEANVKHKVTSGIVNDWKLATFAVNRGVPFIISSKESPLAKDVLSLASIIAESEEATGHQDGQPKAKGIGGRLGLFRKRP